MSDHPASSPASGSRSEFARALEALKRRLVQEAAAAVAMLESALEALWRRDAEAAREVRRRDDTIDAEEVRIETECFRLLTLQHPLARDFRMLAFVLKVNADVERVADHASGIAKVVTRLDPQVDVPWPNAAREMGTRVPAMCHALLGAVLEENVEAARRVVEEDDVIDALDRQLFHEVEALMMRDPRLIHNGLLVYRVGRELERVGDLMKNIAEDVIYLVSGDIVRHRERPTPLPPLASEGSSPRPGDRS